MSLIALAPFQNFTTCWKTNNNNKMPVRLHWFDNWSFVMMFRSIVTSELWYLNRDHSTRDQTTHPKCVMLSDAFLSTGAVMNEFSFIWTKVHVYTCSHSGTLIQNQPTNWENVISSGLAFGQGFTCMGIGRKCFWRVISHQGGLSLGSFYYIMCYQLLVVVP